MRFCILREGRDLLSSQKAVEARGGIKKVHVLWDVDIIAEYALANFLRDLVAVGLKVASCAPSKVDHYLN